MITDNRIFFIGFLIFVLPLLGLPLFWKLTVIMLCGVSLMTLSIKFGLPKSQKPVEPLPPPLPEISHHEETHHKIAEHPVAPTKRPARPRKKKVEDISF